MNIKKIKLTAHDWLDIALQALAENGVTAVAVEPLAKKLGVTKGSFYWHFKNRNTLFNELLEFWESIELEYQNKFENDPIKASDSLKNILTVLITDKTNKHVFLALSNSNKDQTIQKFYNKAVKRRIKLFISSYLNMGLTEEEAESRAAMTYCTYLGLIKSLEDDNADILTNKSKAQLINNVIESAIRIDR